MAGKLSTRRIQAIVAKNELGTFGDGDGLSLQVMARVAADGSTRYYRSWIYRYQVNGKRREAGLGSLDAVGLAAARDKAAELRAQTAKRVDPLEARRIEREQAAAQTAAEAEAEAAAKVKATTFEDVATEYIRAHRAGWRNAKHADQWTNTLKAYAYPVFADTPIDEIDTDLVMKVLRPIWEEKTETASRVRSRIELVLNYAKALKLRSGENPAGWRGHLDALLPRPSKVAPVRHHPALAFREIGDFLKELRTHKGTGALALEFLILTAARTSEVLNMPWSEVDLVNRVWTVPGSRMKAAKEHRVPLSDAAIAVLGRAAALRQNEWVFPGVRTLRPMSDMALTMLLRDIRPGVTAHGFRSTFRDWAAEVSSHPHEAAEMALAHAVGDKVEAAYRRGDMFERRRHLMEDWAQWCATGPGAKAPSPVAEEEPA